MSSIEPCKRLGPSQRHTIAPASCPATLLSSQPSALVSLVPKTPVSPVRPAHRVLFPLVPTPGAYPSSAPKWLVRQRALSALHRLSSIQSHSSHCWLCFSSLSCKARQAAQALAVSLKPLGGPGRSHSNTMRWQRANVRGSGPCPLSPVHAAIASRRYPRRGTAGDRRPISIPARRNPTRPTQHLHRQPRARASTGGGRNRTVPDPGTNQAPVRTRTRTLKTPCVRQQPTCGTGGGSTSWLSKFSKLEVSSGLRTRGLKGDGSRRCSSAFQSMRLNQRCRLISSAPRRLSLPSRLSGLTCGGKTSVQRRWRKENRGRALA